MFQRYANGAAIAYACGLDRVAAEFGEAANALVLTTAVDTPSGPGLRSWQGVFDFFLSAGQGAVLTFGCRSEEWLNEAREARAILRRVRLPPRPENDIRQFIDAERVFVVFRPPESGRQRQSQ